MATPIAGQSAVKLSPETYAQLLSAERTLHDFLPEFDKAEECGIDCQVYRQATNDYLQLMANMKKNYKP